MEVKFKYALFLLPLLLSATAVEPFSWPSFNPFSYYSDPSLVQTSKASGISFGADPSKGISYGPPGQASPVSDPNPVPFDPNSLGNSINMSSNTPAANIRLNGYAGEWKLVSSNAGVSAMHMVIMKHNKAVMFDSTVFGPSQIRLAKGNCRVDPHSKTKALDCWAHGVEFDWVTGKSRPLKVLTDPWCSTGSFDVDGNLIQAGGFNDGGRGIRLLSPCNTCDFKETTVALTGTRWYSSQANLADGRHINIGGRREFGYEYLTPNGKAEGVAYPLPFLRETTDPVENNLYPFVYLIPDGTVFIFANNRAVLLDPKKNTVVRQYPRLPGGSRNYPASGMSTLLPLRLRGGVSAEQTRAEVIVCGGGDPRGFKYAEKGIFLPATKTCGRIVVNKPNAQWHMEDMPVARTMGDMLVLPNAEVLLINGASRGAAGWWFARDPVLSPLLYTPTATRNERFAILAPTKTPRMYHSTAAVLPDASILVAGSNPNNVYKFANVSFRTEVSVEVFFPPYFSPKLASLKAVIDEKTISGGMAYGKNWSFEFSASGLVVRNDVMVTMYSLPFTTHGYSVNQRLLILHVQEFTAIGNGRFKVVVSAPATSAIAPAGYYLVYLVNKNVPSKGVWVQIK